jgi:hypothetical protein
MLKHTIASAALLALAVNPLAGQRRGTFLVPTADIATTRVAQRGANFLEIGVGARAQGLGYAGTAMITGATASYWNPAGLATMDGITMAFSRSNLYDDLGITHSFASAGIAFAGGGLALSYIRLDSGDIPRATEDDPGADAVQEGAFFSFAGTAIGVSYGRRLTDRLQVGMTARVVNEGIDRAQASWWGLDFGTLFNTGLYGLTLGAALTNIGSSAAYEGTLITNRITTREAFAVNLPVRYNTTPYQMPTSFRFAVVSDLIGGADALLGASGNHSFKVAVDLNDGTDTDLQTALGAEYNFRNMVFLRGGKRFVNEANDDFRSFSDFLSFGGGIRLPILGRRLGFDYAFTNMGELQNVQTFSFEFGN